MVCRCVAAARQRPAARILAALAAGAALALSLPPLDLLPAVAAYGVLLALAEASDDVVRRPLLARAVLGAAFGFAYHLAGLWWIGAAFLVDAPTYGALLPFAVIGLPLVLAPFHGAALALAGLACGGPVVHAVGFAAALGLTEWIRSFAFTGFPWNVPAVQLSGSLELAQAVSVVGLAGVTPLVVLLGAAPVLLLRGRRLAAGAILSGAALVFVGGAVRLAQAPATDGPRVRIIQPAIPQREKWDPAHAPQIWRTLLALTAAPAEEGARPGVVVWPETALPFLYRTPSAVQAELIAALGGSTLITGTVEVERGAGSDMVTNSIAVIGPDGIPLGRYDKAHLVPFGEYVPFAPLLERLGLTALAGATADFTPGEATATLAVPGLPPARPLICYEAIFPQAGVIQPAAWIVNVTNDAWFGDTPGPHQHLQLAVLRAIEAGTPIVRAANTGISALIDAYGRVPDNLQLNRRDRLDVRVPQSVHTVYHQAPRAPIVVMTGLLLGLVARYYRRGRVRRARSVDGIRNARTAQLP
ncbi:apolipoprotein N-acyltransferase [Acuticoccus sp.]|uniref:apolipoprotein N-acyltransferase n=1 Tax=Acuticoccus sp. TaxID=1904378 RepID=UPI003B52DD17